MPVTERKTMALRSRVSPRFFVNELATAMSDDWATSYSLMKYQMAKGKL